MAETGFGVEGAQKPAREELLRGRGWQAQPRKRPSLCGYNTLRKGRSGQPCKSQGASGLLGALQPQGAIPRNGSCVTPSLLQTPVLCPVRRCCEQTVFMLEFSKPDPEAVVCQVPVPGGQAAGRGTRREEPPGWIWTLLRARPLSHPFPGACIPCQWSFNSHPISPRTGHCEVDIPLFVLITFATEMAVRCTLR